MSFPRKAFFFGGGGVSSHYSVSFNLYVIQRTISTCVMLTAAIHTSIFALLSLQCHCLLMYHMWTLTILTFTSHIEFYTGYNTTDWMMGQIQQQFMQRKIGVRWPIRHKLALKVHCLKTSLYDGHLKERKDGNNVKRRFKSLGCDTVLLGK